MADQDESFPDLQNRPTLIEITNYKAVVDALTEDVVVEFFRAFAAVDRWDTVNAIWQDFESSDFNDLRHVGKNWVIHHERSITLKMFADAIHKMSTALEKASLPKPEPHWGVLDATRQRLNSQSHRSVRDRVAAHMDPEPIRDALRTRDREVRGPLPVVRLAPDHLPLYGLAGIALHSLMSNDDFDAYLTEADIRLDARVALMWAFYALVVVKFPEPSSRPIRFREVPVGDLFRMDVTGFFAGEPQQ